jgi:hypothetical protein
MDIKRPVIDHYVYLVGMAISGVFIGILLRLLVYKNASSKT